MISAGYGQWVVLTAYGPAVMSMFPPPEGVDTALAAAYWREAERRAGRPSNEAVLAGAPATADDWYEALAFVLNERSPA